MPIILILSLVLCFNIFKWDEYKSNKTNTIIISMIIISMFVIIVYKNIFDIIITYFNISPNLIIAFLPLSLTPIMISILVGLRAAIFSSIYLMLLVTIKFNNYNIIILGVVISCSAAYFVYKAQNYKLFFIRSAIIVPITVIPMELVISIIDFVSIKSIIHTIALSLVNGLTVGLISITLLFIFESTFQISTAMNLANLCDYNHPLLKRLQLEAPGTYHHSLITAILVEHAAISIGANHLKARAAALFHDIGKLANSEYFIENNPLAEQKHNMLKPAISSMIILNHVKEGITLALKYKLNRVVRDAILQHHGTDLVYYFYRKAIDENKEINTITEKEYRYPGPKPISKEIALLMIADSCEAACRTLEKPTPSKIESLVGEIIRKKIRDGQLDNANLTFAEMATAKKNFVRTLTTMLHSRINYPIEEDDDAPDLFKSPIKKQSKYK